MAYLYPVSTQVVTISGTSGAGKKSLVKKVAELLGDAAMLHFDDYQPVATYPTDIAGWVEQGRSLDEWKIPQLLDDLKALRSGRAVILPDGREVLPASYIVLEEPSGRVRAGLRELIDFSIFVDIPLDIALARKVTQYLAQCAQEPVAVQLRAAVQTGQEYYAKYVQHREYYLTVIEQARKDCDLVLDGTRPLEFLAQDVVNSVHAFPRHE